MTGYIHSTESFGTVDGPGIRFVIFMQGCPLRCLYCHNPDTWKPNTGKAITADEILGEYLKNLPFYKNGGITVSGGEPLLQIDFLTQLFKMAKEHKIHTCIDTSGITFLEQDLSYTKKLDALLKYTDLILLDIKHIDPFYHKSLTGADNKNVLAFAKYLEEKNIPIWVRHVVVEGYTDNPKHLFDLGQFIGGLKNLKALDVLAYHTLGVHKYKELGLSCPLEGLAPLDPQKAKKAKQIILQGIKSVRE